MNAVEERVKELVKVELAAANEKYPAFHSAHEGYAMIREEVEEAFEQMDYTTDKLSMLWMHIKANDFHGAMQWAAAIKRHAELGACKMMQVAAMAQKFLDMENGHDASVEKFAHTYSIHNDGTLDDLDQCAKEFVDYILAKEG